MTPTEIRALLDEARTCAPSKALGQHFLADPNTARRIVRLAGIEPAIGSSRSARCRLADRSRSTDAGARVLAVELDRHLLPVLAGGGRAT